MLEIKVWAQMFFDDGSLSPGTRIPATIFDESLIEFENVARKILKSLNRTEGLLLVWGAGDMFYRYYSISFPSEESKTSASET